VSFHFLVNARRASGLQKSVRNSGANCRQFLPQPTYRAIRRAHSRPRADFDTNDVKYFVSNWRHSDIPGGKFESVSPLWRASRQADSPDTARTATDRAGRPGQPGQPGQILTRGATSDAYASPNCLSLEQKA